MFKVYTDDEAAQLEKWEQMYFNTVTGEAVQFFPKPEVDPDMPGAITRQFRDRDVYLGTGLFFETPYQYLPTSQNLEAREPQRVAPWNFAKADTVTTVTEALRPMLKAKGAEVTGVALAKQNSQFPYLHADGTELRSRELMLVTGSGETVRCNVGQLAATLAHSVSISAAGTDGQYNPVTIVASVEAMLHDAGASHHTDSSALDVDRVADGE